MDELISHFNQSFHLSKDEYEILVTNHEKLVNNIMNVSSDVDFVKGLHIKNIVYSEKIVFDPNINNEKHISEKLDIIVNTDHTRYPVQYCQLTLQLLQSFLSFLNE